MKESVLIRNLLILLFFNFGILGCSSQEQSGTTNSSTPPAAYCSTVIPYSSAVTIIGTAQYEYRTNGNGAVASPNPIRYAEIRVTSSAGALIQCGETDGSGNFSLQLPNNSDVATIEVTSRSANSFANVYVLQNPTQNTYHSISTQVTLDGSKSAGTLTALATGTLEGGAFNILDKIIDSNDFLRANTANCNLTFSACTPFTVNPLLYVYWARGVNPGSYFSQPPLSFYLAGLNQLYILGGVDGDVDSSDTDHFDDTIIIHEYGHFLEDAFAKIDSPGGLHNGDSIIDARLAWGEAWANYFQSLVTGLSVYRDTFGTPLGTAGVFINESLESGTKDVPGSLGEGNFREFSITRALVDITDATNEGPGVDQLTAPFSEVWTLFNSSTAGFKSPSVNFRNLGLFYELQNVLPGKSNWVEIQTAENQRPDRTDYANTLTIPGSCGTTTIQAANISAGQPENGTVANSNHFASNDFYEYNHSGGALTIALNYTTLSGSPADLDLYLYQNEYTFGSASSVVGSSEATINVGTGAASETISLGTLAAGTYMININVNTAIRLGAAAQYSLTINGQLACPN